MGQFLFRLPDVGEGVAEAEIVAWHVRVGDHVEEDQMLVDVMTDKATVEMTSPMTGRVQAVHGGLGQRVPVGSVLVELDVDGDANVPRPVAASQPARPAPEPAPVPPSPVPISPEPLAAIRSVGATLLAAPATRRRAHELGVPLRFVPGTGPAGRITPQDLDAYIRQGGPSPTPVPARRTGVTEVRIIGLRRRIAEKMQEAKQRIPHFGYVEEFDLTELEGLRQELNEAHGADQPRLTLLPFFMRALVRLLPDFAQINARYDDEAGILHSHEGVHVGIATQTPGGLMVPVIRHVEALDLWDCARELARVTAAARDGSAAREELTGSTITLTSLGALGGISATPVINHPEVAIIGPNKLIERPVVRAGRVTVRSMMNVSSSFDHRIVDGYDAARFIQGLKRLIERPALLFMDHT